MRALLPAHRAARKARIIIGTRTLLPLHRTTTRMVASKRVVGYANSDVVTHTHTLRAK